MAVYVFALVDEPPPGRAGRGLTGALSLRKVANAFAVVERRGDVPPADFGSMQRHQAVLQELSDRVPAILPVRFGTLLETKDLEESLCERDDEIAEAFDTVRGRVQFSWRRRSAGSASSTGSKRAGSEHTVLSGADYLRQAARRLRPVPPPRWRPVCRILAPLVAAERFQPASATLPESLYHLVDRSAARRYAAAATPLRDANPLLSLTGPWPPFAFTPELL